MCDPPVSSGSVASRRARLTASMTLGGMAPSALLSLRVAAASSGCEALCCRPPLCCVAGATSPGVTELPVVHAAVAAAADGERLAGSGRTTAGGYCASGRAPFRGKASASCFGDVGA